MTTEGTDNNKCSIRAETKLRNGHPNWWCFTHFAPARGKHGEQLAKCMGAATPPIPEKEQLHIALATLEKDSSISLLTSPLVAAEHDDKTGIRVASGGGSGIYSELHIASEENEVIVINTAIAQAYCASALLGKSLKIIACPHCKHSHIDADYFAIHYHKKHLCSYCNRSFYNKEEGISNPVYQLRELLKGHLNERDEPANNTLEISKNQCIRIWAQHPALINTGLGTAKTGIGVEWLNNGAIITGIYQRITIAGIELDAAMMRYYDVQRSMAYLNKYIVSLQCPACGRDHFDTGEKALNLHKIHECEHCGQSFTDSTRFKGVVSNPAAARLRLLAKI